MWDLSSLIRYQTCTPPAFAAQSLNHWTTREVLISLLINRMNLITNTKKMCRLKIQSNRT